MGQPVSNTIKSMKVLSPAQVITRIEVQKGQLQFDACYKAEVHSNSFKDAAHCKGRTDISLSTVC